MCLKVDVEQTKKTYNVLSQSLPVSLKLRLQKTKKTAVQNISMF